MMSEFLANSSRYGYASILKALDTRCIKVGQPYPFDSIGWSMAKAPSARPAYGYIHKIYWRDR